MQQHGDEEANHTDEDFLNALEIRYAPNRRYRLRYRPPCDAADRFSQAIRDVLLFPTMKSIDK